MTQQACRVVFAVGLLAGVGSTQADEAVQFSEKFHVDHQYHAQTRVEVSGSLLIPGEKGKPGKTVKVDGTANVDYDERILELKDEQVVRTLRGYTKLAFQRTTGERKMKLDLRPATARMVILRRGAGEEAFSPDGPLTLDEQAAVSTDVFTPALVGLFPTTAVKAGDRWTATEEAIRELTDLEKIDSGKLECRLDRLNKAGRRWARVTLSGTVQGVGEDGPARHKLQGYYVFDLDENFLSELVLNGRQTMVKDDKELGSIDGRFVLTRTQALKSPKMTRTALEGVKLTPEESNTWILHDNPILGVRFQYPRAWKKVRETPAQVALDNGKGSSLMVTVEPVDQMPSAAAFLKESQGVLTKYKTKVGKTYNPRRIRATPPLDGFAIEAEIGGEPFWMDYYVTLQTLGGATVAVRMPLSAELDARRKEAEAMARSIAITKRIVVPKAKGK